MDMSRASINGRGHQATPPPPPRPSQHQLLRCHGSGSIANNYQRSTSAPAPTTSNSGLPNSYSVASGIESNLKIQGVEKKLDTLPDKLTPFKPLSQHFYKLLADHIDSNFFSVRQECLASVKKF